jgi:hypothetical protein
MGPDGEGLLPVMQKNLPSSFRIVLAHQCNYRGRRYIHLAASDGRHLMSLLITNREQGEAFEGDLRAIANESDNAVFTSSAQRFGISGFETARHLIYLVSDVDPDQNLATFRAMVPEIARTIRTREI